jgi:hypothetical protein
MVKVKGIAYSEREWKKALKSNRGLFKRLGSVPRNIAGPTLTADFDITGDAGMMEITDVRLCSEEQQAFFQELVGQDHIKAMQYAFTITNADKVWQKKIASLQTFLKHVKLEEEELLDEEIIVSRAEKMRSKLDPELEKYFPEDYKALKNDIDNLEKFRNDLEKAVSHLKIVEKKINTHLAQIQANFPFLF